MIYLDHNATTPLDPRVLEAMLPYLTNEYFNASSSHAFGIRTKQRVTTARQVVSDILNCSPDEIIFSSGATESVNLAIKGAAKHFGNRRRHIVTIATEHPAVLDTCKSLETEGFDITYLEVKKDGTIDLDELTASILPSTFLISAMFVNNETGVINPIKQIGEIAKDRGVLFMCDATQAVGKISIDLSNLWIDFLAFSAHKFYGPKGIGALYAKRSHVTQNFSPILHGGGHEFGFRSGTLNVPGIIGLSKALEIASFQMSSDETRIGALRDLLEIGLLDFPKTFLNGNPKQRIYTTTNIGFKNRDANVLIGQLRTVAVSNGSACASAVIEPSHVLIAMGLDPEDAFASMRFSLGRETTLSHIEQVIAKIRILI